MNGGVFLGQMDQRRAKDEAQPLSVAGFGTSTGGAGLIQGGGGGGGGGHAQGIFEIEPPGSLLAIDQRTVSTAGDLAVHAAKSTGDASVNIDRVAAAAAAADEDAADRSTPFGQTYDRATNGTASKGGDNKGSRDSLVDGPEDSGRHSEEDAVGADRDSRSSWPELTPALCVLGPPSCILILVVGLIKAAIVVVPTVVIIVVGTTGTAIYLFPSTCYRTYRAIWQTKQLYGSQKIVSMGLLALPLLLWPILVLAGSAIASFLYGLFGPQLATFEAVRRERSDSRLLHILKDGVPETLVNATTVVRDFADFCLHSFPAYLEDFEKQPRATEQPPQIKLLLLPGCLAVGLLGILVDTPLISTIAAGRSVTMIYRGWQQLLCSAVEREGPCEEGVCLPVAFLAMVAWPFFVVLVVVLAALSSPFIGLYAGVVAYKENSLRLGALYTVAAAAEFDEYVNELLELGSKSCLPKPAYRRKHFKNQEGESLHLGAMGHHLSSRQSSFRSVPGLQAMDRMSGSVTSEESSGRRNGGVLTRIATSHTMKESFEETRLAQIWSFFFHQAWLQGQEVCNLGVLEEADLADWLAAKKTRGSVVAGEGLVGLALLRMLQVSHQEGSRGLLLMDGLEILPSNRPKDRIFDWFFEPLVELKEQLAAARLSADEDRYVEAWVLATDEAGRLRDWLGAVGVPGNGKRKAELESFGRRLLGMATSITRIPTFRRRHERVVAQLLDYKRESSQQSTDSHGVFVKSRSEP